MTEAAEPAADIDPAVVDLWPIAEADAPRVQELASHPEVIATTMLPSPYPEGGALDFIRRSIAGRARGTDFVYVLVTGGEVVGTCAAHDIARGTGEIGYWIGRPYWGRRLGSVAARRLVAGLFERLPLDRLTAHCLVGNTASEQILHGLGFEPTSSSPSTDPKWQPPVTITRYELPRERWSRHAIRLAPFEPNPQSLARLEGWLRRPHVARWFPVPDDVLGFASQPPATGDQRWIVVDDRPVGYLRWQRVDAEDLAAVGLDGIPDGAVDCDLFLGEREQTGRGLGVEALHLVLDRLRENPSIPLVGLTTSTENTRAQRAFRAAGFQTVHEYAPKPFGPCLLMARRLRRPAL
ncbi:MAG: GNAT family N-acetyltransferase [Acidobacteriota bacterium]